MPTGFVASHTGVHEIESIKEYIDGRLSEADRRYQQRYDWSQSSIEKQHDAYEKRFEALNGYRGILTDQMARSPSRQELDALGSMLRTERQAQFEPLREKIEQLGRPNWPLMLGGFGVLITLASGLWTIVGLKIDAASAPMLTAISTADVDRRQINERLRTVEASSAGSAAADAASRSDRQQLNDRMRGVETRQADIATSASSFAAEMRSSFVEVETQMKNASTAMNLTSDHDQQIMSVMWSTLFPKSPLPVTSYRPQLQK